jgi:predicted MFS family arabinose efflux permease
MQAGYLGGAVGAGATLWLAEHLSVRLVAILTAGMVFLPSLLVLAINEPDKNPSGNGLFTQLTELIEEIKACLRSPTFLEGFLTFASPVGSAAALYLFSGIAVDYHASVRTVTFVTGFAAGALTAVGSVAGGYVCDYLDRRLSYIISGVLTALASLTMLLGPYSQANYIMGSSFYALAGGFCYAAFAALALEIVGVHSQAAATRFSLLVAIGNLPITYMAWADGQGYRTSGPRGLLGVDAAANVAAAVLLLLVLPRVCSRRPFSRKVLTEPTV